MYLPIKTIMYMNFFLYPFACFDCSSLNYCNKRELHIYICICIPHEEKVAGGIVLLYF